MSQTVWIARHGNRIDFVNPEWFDTAERRYDPHLSEDGFIQAKELAQRLKQEKIEHIFTSPFLRTIQTANEVAQVLDLPIKIEAGLSEWHNSEWMNEVPETHPKELLKAEFPRLDWSYQSLLTPQYPETEAEVNQRTAETAKRLVAKYSENLLIVGHGASVWGATKGLIPEYPVFEVSLCCLVKIVRNGDKWQLELCGDTSHLSQTETTVRLN
ncbi:histidine phosphatase family protein [Myxosarcina sp. GI1]|uniref:histidine phosphatase family protein n=1 Tax=Myxosarcina sp. GI1 TaxID=1541065 RepID=UPI00055AEEA4|nr:histidine phosphatase family protein [Myxosarcina sp. GI1]